MNGAIFADMWINKTTPDQMVAYLLTFTNDCNGIVIPHTNKQPVDHECPFFE